MSFKSSYAAGVILAVLFFIYFTAADFLVKRDTRVNENSAFDWSRCMDTAACR